jgi:hypothetical protein
MKRLGQKDNKYEERIEFLGVDERRKGVKIKWVIGFKDL